MMDCHHDSFHKALTGKEAVERLKICGSNHCYLTRYSEAKKCYRLTVYKKEQKETVKHFQLSIEKKGEGEQKVYKIDGKTAIFSSIHEMLQHYENKQIDPAILTIGQFVTEQQYLGAKFSAAQKELENALQQKQRELEVAKQEYERVEQETKLKLKQVEEQKQRELEAVEQEKQNLEKKVLELSLQAEQPQHCCTIL